MIHDDGTKFNPADSKTHAAPEGKQELNVVRRTEIISLSSMFTDVDSSPATPIPTAESKLKQIGTAQTIANALNTAMTSGSTGEVKEPAQTNHLDSPVKGAPDAKVNQSAQQTFTAPMRRAEAEAIKIKAFKHETQDTLKKINNALDNPSMTARDLESVMQDLAKFESTVQTFKFGLRFIEFENMPKQDKLEKKIEHELHGIAMKLAEKPSSSNLSPDFNSLLLINSFCDSHGPCETFEVVKMMANQVDKPDNSHRFFMNVVFNNKLGIEKADQRFEIAKILATKDPIKLQENISFLQINNQRQMLELVKDCCMNCPDQRIFADNFNSLFITHNADLLDIAKLCLSNSPSDMTPRISRILERHNRFEQIQFVKFLAEKNDPRLPHYIAEFQLDISTTAKPGNSLNTSGSQPKINTGKPKSQYTQMSISDGAKSSLVTVTKIKNNVEVNKIFSVERLLGKGGMGTAYELIEIDTQGSFVPGAKAKVLKVAHDSDYARETMKKGFEVMKDQYVDPQGNPIGNIPGIVKPTKNQVHDLALQSLYGRGNASPTGTPPKNLDEPGNFMGQTCFGLNHMHTKIAPQGIFPGKRALAHRDIKGDNIFCREEIHYDETTKSNVTVLKYGIADLDGAHDATIDPKGTTYTKVYVCHEDASLQAGNKIGQSELEKFHKSLDVYALGVTYREFMTGKSVLNMLGQKKSSGHYNLQRDMSVSDLPDQMLFDMGDAEIQKAEKMIGLINKMTDTKWSSRPSSQECLAELQAMGIELPTYPKPKV